MLIALIGIMDDTLNKIIRKDYIDLAERKHYLNLCIIKEEQHKKKQIRSCRFHYSDG